MSTTTEALEASIRAAAQEIWREHPQTELALNLPEQLRSTFAEAFGDEPMEDWESGNATLDGVGAIVTFPPSRFWRHGEDVYTIVIEPDKHVKDGITHIGMPKPYRFVLAPTDLTPEAQEVYRRLRLDGMDGAAAREAALLLETNAVGEQS